MIFIALCIASASKHYSKALHLQLTKKTALKTYATDQNWPATDQIKAVDNFVSICQRVVVHFKFRKRPRHFNIFLAELLTFDISDIKKIS